MRSYIFEHIIHIETSTTGIRCIKGFSNVNRGPVVLCEFVLEDMEWFLDLPKLE